MSVQYCDMEDSRSVISSGAVSQAYSCPPVPLRKGGRMKKAAPLPPSKVTTPLSLSLSDLHPKRPLSLSTLPPPSSLLRDQGDECAINELLEGRMDLDVVLPDARKVRMNVERRTPMMDLLVQVTTAHKINPGGHVIHIPTDRGRDYLQYKPNTPIGSLDTNSINIVPKSAVFDPPIKKMPKMANKPFEQTFRLQVNLPRSQFTVMRVGPRMTLGEVKLQACREKNLDPSRYMLTHPQRPDAILDLNSSMSAYGATEITLISNSNFNTNMCNSATDIIAYVQREDNQKKKGILGLFTRKKSKGSVVDSSSDSLDSRGVSPSRSDGSGPRTTSAKVSIKKRPAPPPPPKTTNQIEETVQTTSSSLPTIEEPICKTDGSTVSHSRHSSDSSGYHEASVLSESPDNHSPDVCSGSSVDSSSQPVSNRRKTSTPTRPTQPKVKPVMMSSLSDTQLLVTAANRKRRAPPPPPILPKGEREQSEFVKSTSEALEGVILEEPTSVNTEEEEDDGTGSKTPSPEPASSPPVSEAESGLVEDIERPLPLHLPGSPRCDSPPSSPHTDSGLMMEDSPDDLEDVDLIYPYVKGVIPPPEPFVNPLLTGGLETVHETVEATNTNFSAYSSRHRFFSALKHWVATNPHSQDDAARRTSLTSLGTIDDVQNSFDLTIAEAQKVLDDEEKRLSLSSDDILDEHESVEEVPVVVEVSQHQILSRIEAAFSALERENTLDEVAKPTPKDDDLGWDYTIPEPPPAFRNDIDEKESSRTSTHSSSVSSVSSEEIAALLPVLAPPRVTSNPVYVEEQSPKKREAVVYEQPALVLLKVETPLVTEIVKPMVKSSPTLKEPAPVKRTEPAPNVPVKENGTSEVKEVREASESRVLLRKPRRPPLMNFTIGTYRRPKEDIFSPFDEDSKPVPNSAPVLTGEPLSVPVTKSVSLDVPAPAPKNVLMYGMEGSVRGIKGQVRLRCAEMVDTGGPALVARSASMLSLTPTSRKIEVDGKVKNVQRTTSNVTDRLRKTQSVQDLNLEGCDENANLEQEQERLQQEYSKLHEQFLIWNQQLQDNQSLLEKQKIVSVSTLRPPLPVKESEKMTNGTTASSIAVMAEEVAARSQTLPRSKPKPLVEQPPDDKRTFTLDRRPKSQILANVTIGSWQQRKSIENISTLPANDKSQYHSLDIGNSAVVPEEKRNGHHYPSNKPPVSKRPVSMYSSWQKPQIDETDRQKPKFDIHFSSNQSSQPNSLRTSSTKTYFKPPEVRSSSITRQRIPPEDLQNPPEDTGNSINIWKVPLKDTGNRDSSALKKFAFGHNEPNECNSNGKTVTYLNADKANNDSGIKMVQVNGKMHTSNGLSNRPSFSVKSAPKVVGFRLSSGSESVANGKPNGACAPPPPPPPPPVSKVPSEGLPKTVVPPKAPVQKTRSAKSAQLLSAQRMDPREELMSEIRSFGGRKTLKKVPVSQINWQLKVHGNNSAITA